MIGALIILAALIAVGTVLYLLDKHTAAKTSPQDPNNLNDLNDINDLNVVNSLNATAPSVDPETGCCGQHLVCEKDSLLVTNENSAAEYFEDEDLDDFIGRNPATYTPEETEQFRDVLLTLLPSDVAPWARSIQQRGIELPADVREELLLIISERRSAVTSPTHN